MMAVCRVVLLNYRNSSEYQVREGRLGKGKCLFSVSVARVRDLVVFNTLLRDASVKCRQYIQQNCQSSEVWFDESAVAVFPTFSEIFDYFGDCYPDAAALNDYLSKYVGVV